MLAERLLLFYRFRVIRRRLTIPKEIIVKLVSGEQPVFDSVDSLFDKLEAD